MLYKENTTLTKNVFNKFTVLETFIIILYKNEISKILNTFNYKYTYVILNKN